MSSSTAFTFTFAKEKVTLDHPNAQSFLIPVISSLYTFFPPSKKSNINILPEMEIPSLPAPPDQFVDIFLSVCHSVSITPQINLIKNLRRTLIKKQPLEILQVSFEQDVLRAICQSLILVRNVQNLTIGGYKFPDLFKNISNILTSNKSLETLRIVDYSKHNDFLDFIKSISDSGLKSLTFSSVSFQRIMIQSLVDCISISPNLKHVGFVNCNFDSFVFGSIFSSPEKFKNIELFEICKDCREVTLSFVPNLISFIKISGITNLVLTEVAIDIAQVFATIENTPNIMIKSIDLSGNYCSKAYNKHNPILNSSLENLRLSEVRWNDQTFFTFLQNQQFQSEITLDLSGASFPWSIALEPFESLSGSSYSMNVSKLIWNNNIITPLLLLFLSKNASLRFVSFEMCRIPLNARINFLEAMSSYIKFTNLVSLSLKGTLRTFKSDSIDGLRTVLINHETLEKLDISDNNIGNKGLEAFAEVICNPKCNINQVYCDDEDPQDSDLYIDFFNKIADSKKQIHMKKPKNDIRNLITNLGAPREPIITAWKRVKEIQTVAENKNDDEEDNLPLPKDNNGEDFLLDEINNMLFSTDSFFQSVAIEASWDMTFDIGYNGFKEEWEKLEKEYMVENIIGIENSKFEGTDHSDLIDFTQ